MFFGYIRDYKGLDLLLDAWGMLKREGKLEGHKLIVAGEYYSGKERYAEQIDALGIRGDLVLMDRYISDGDVAKLFSAADLVVQPYRHATQSGVTQIRLLVRRADGGDRGGRLAGCLFPTVRSVT